MKIERTPGWSFRILAGALALVAMVLPRLPRFRPSDIVGGVIPVGPFSGGLLDGNIMLMSALLVASAGVMTWLRPEHPKQGAVILGLAPTVWMVIVMVLHGPGDIWPIALVFTLGYGAIVAGVGFGLGKLLRIALESGQAAWRRLTTRSS